MVNQLCSFFQNTHKSQDIDLADPHFLILKRCVEGIIWEKLFYKGFTPVEVMSQSQLRSNFYKTPRKRQK